VATVLGPRLPIAGAAALAAAAFIGCPQPDGDSSAAIVHWQVEISEPAAGLAHVRGEFPAAALSGLVSLQLEFGELSAHPERLRSIEARAGDEALSVQANGHTLAFDLASVAGPVVMDYTIDPTFYPPGGAPTSPADARSRITEDLAVVRTTALFPRVNIRELPATVVFDLPNGWLAVTPWHAADAGFALELEPASTVEYLGLGPLELGEISAGGSVFRVATGDADLSLDAVTNVLRFELELLGAPPASRGRRSIVVVPAAFMRGGAAGRNSIVQPPRADVLAHEMFHWWNRPALTRAETTWFREGFTQYYGVKAALMSAAWTEEDADRCLADLNAEMRYLERDGALSLSAASLDYTSDGRARRLTYSKGALLALYLDRELESTGRSLDEAMRKLLTGEYVSMGNDDVRRVVSETYEESVDSILESYVVGNAALPDLALDAHTGSSGCARFLPDR
jgi:hypothetical protein